MMHLQPFDAHEMRALAKQDAAAAVLRMSDRLHRAFLVDGAAGAAAGRHLHSLQPGYLRAIGDESYSGTQVSDREWIERIESWGRLLAIRPIEYDLAFETLLWLQGCPDRRAWRVLGWRAWQEHVSRESWRSIGRIVGTSHTKARAIHFDACQYALQIALGVKIRANSSSARAGFAHGVR